MKKLMMLLVAARLTCGTVAAKDIRIAVTLSIDPSLSRSRTTAIFRGYLETIPNLNLFVSTGDTTEILADPETDVWVLVTVVVVRPGYAFVSFPLRRTLINRWLELGWVETSGNASPDLLRMHWLPRSMFAVSTSSLEDGIGAIVDDIDGYLERYVRPYPNMY